MRIIEVDTRQGYNRWSETYDTTGNPLVAIEEIALTEMLGSIRGLKAVDLGCGTGRNTQKLQALGARVTGVDFSEGMLAKAREASPGSSIQYHQHDLNEPLPFSDNSFDLVLCSLVLEHVEKLGPVLSEMKRIVKQTGFIFISDLHPAMRLKSAQAQFTDHATGEDVRPIGYVHSLSDYVLSITKTGLTIEDMREFDGRSDLVEKFPKMAKYVGWPMLVTFKLRKHL
jgi:ubiquinone/menaquinone biosynthesis C-methylase UbiE